MESIGLWSERVEGGEKLTVIPGATLTITNAALGYLVKDKMARCNLRLHYTPRGLETTVSTDLGSLTPGKVESLQFSLCLERGQAYEFEAQGVNDIAIIGNFQVDEDEDGDFVTPGETEVRHSRDETPPATKGKKSKAAPMAADKPVKEEFPSAKALGKRKASKASTTSTTSDGESSYEEVVELEPKKHKKAPGKKMV